MLRTPSESDIVIPAKERSNVDWDTCNRIAKENSDFVNYLKNIRKFFQTGETTSREWNLDV